MEGNTHVVQANEDIVMLGIYLYHEGYFHADDADEDQSEKIYWGRFFNFVLWVLITVITQFYFLAAVFRVT